MADFTTRIELRDASWEHYVRLHEAMRLSGFSQLIKSDGGVLYELPPAEYNISANLTLLNVRQLAEAAAGKAGVGFSVFVTEAVGRAWSGLQLAKSPLI